MPRHARVAPGGFVYHVFNRGNALQRIFRKDADYHEFVELLGVANERTKTRLLAFTLMPDHWHLVLWPRKEEELSSYMSWLSTTHVRRFHRSANSTGGGHVYQGRYRSFIVQPGTPLLNALRFVESNPLRNGLVSAADEWEWSSLHVRKNGDPQSLLAEGPTPRPRNWTQQVNQPLDDEDLTQLRVCLRRGRPYGDRDWTVKVCKRLGLEFTLRPRGRPRLSDRNTLRISPH